MEAKRTEGKKAFGEGELKDKGIIYFSPLSCGLIRKRLRQGKVGAEWEICTPAKREKCDTRQKCLAPRDTRDPYCYGICRGVVGREIA